MRKRSALTVVELVVVISVSSLLVALCLPALQSARESSRITSCQNNLKQLVTATHLHESSYRFLPSAGWGTAWVGMQDRGVGRRQPGSWIYSLLPFIEANAVHQAAPSALAPLSKVEFQHFSNLSLPFLKCSSRDLPLLLPANESVAYRYGSSITTLAPNDFAISSGDFRWENDLGPTSLNDSNYRWPPSSSSNGMGVTRSELRFADVLDGTSNVIYVGEKWKERQMQYWDKGFDQPWSTGTSMDNLRFTHDAPASDRSTRGDFTHFGSSHSGKCNFVFVDCAVRSIPFSIHPSVFGQLGNRKDGAQVELEF